MPHKPALLEHRLLWYIVRRAGMSLKKAVDLLSLAVRDRLQVYSKSAALSIIASLTAGQNELVRVVWGNHDASTTLFEQ